jgi:hypothetical protein
VIRSRPTPEPLPEAPTVTQVPADDAPESGLSRAALLRGGLAAALAAVAGPRVLEGTAALAAEPAARVSPALSPLDLDFSIIEQFRPFDLLPRRFTQVRERFADAAAAGRYAGAGTQAESRSARAGRVGEALRVRSAAATPTLFRTGARPVAPFATVIVSTGSTAQGSGGEAAVVAGLVRDARNYVVASFDAGRDATRGTVSIDVVVDGVRTRAASGRADLRGPARFAFVVNENYVTALVGNATSWTPVTQSRVTELVDLRDPAVLRNYRYGFGAAGADATVDITGLEAGYFGLAGIRDPHVVNYSDGTPYIRDNKLYFTATQAGLSFFQAAHWGVWTLDLDDPRRIEPVAQIFFARGGLVLGDHAGHIVVDERDGGFHVAASSWGDFNFEGVHVRYVRTFEDVLRGVHVLETQRLALPTRVDSWDPAMVRIDNRWYVGFVESPYQDPVRGFDFHPALARGAVGGRPTRLARVGADLTRGETEGIILQKIGGRWYLLASDGDDRQYRVYDLSVRLLGFLDAPYGTNIPHPQIVPIAEGGRTRYLMITFNGTQYFEPLLGYGTHGDFIVMRAAQTVRGSEFPLRRPGRAAADRAGDDGRPSAPAAAGP